MSISFWRKDVWSDESKFELFGKKKRQRVWRKSNEALGQKFISQTVKYGGNFIDVGLLLLVQSWKFSCSMESLTLSDISTSMKINENLEESVEKMENIANDFVFQQDNTPIHKSPYIKFKKTIKFLENSGIEVLDWPSQSPDLNPH